MGACLSLNFITYYDELLASIMDLVSVYQFKGEQAQLDQLCATHEANNLQKCEQNWNGWQEVRFNFFFSKKYSD